MLTRLFCMKGPASGVLPVHIRGLLFPLPPVKLLTRDRVVMMMTSV